MRVAVCGTHRVGKTTLVDALAERLPGYDCLDEPYRLLEEEGYDFSHPPSLDDFEAQLERSIESIEASGDETLFDRCPVDIAAYLLVHPDADGGVLEPWLEAIRAALEALDLIVFIPLDPGAADPDDALQSDMNRALEDVLWDRTLALDVPVLTVEGGVAARTRAVLARL